jgi:GT2 family glycosyltransferase
MVTAMNIAEELASPQDIVKVNPKDKESTAESEHPDFSAFMISKETYETIGQFDDGFFPAYFEDNDYHYRINLAGMKAITYPMAIYYHYGSRTQTEAKQGVPVVSNTLFEINRERYVRKWGGLPGQEKFKTPFNS